MRVLHVWDAAGVASTIAKFMDRDFGTESVVIKRMSLDTFGAITYGGHPVSGGPVGFYAQALLMARKFDLINVHSVQRIIPWLKRFYGDKPVVFTRHGVGRSSGKGDGWKKADAVVVVNPYLIDLMPGCNAEVIPPPVDTEFFSPGPKRGQGALTFTYRADELAKKYSDGLGLDLFVSERNVPYIQVPELFRKYAVYVDVKRDFTGEILPALSKTGLEALACGLKVVRWDGKMVEELPEVNRPEYVARRNFEVYSKVLAKGGSAPGVAVASEGAPAK